MKTKEFLLVLLTIFLSAQQIKAQDKIYKKTDEVIICKVKEIGLDDVKYQLPDQNDEITYCIDKYIVSKLILENGEEIVFKDNFNNPENYLDNKRNAFKIDFMSPLTGNTSFSYERSSKPSCSYEITIGIIGLGIDPNDNDQSGLFFKGGVKFIKSPDFYLRGIRYAHILKGSYIKPEIAFGFYKRNYKKIEFYSNSKSTRESFVSGAIFLNLGKQWIYDNSFLLDFYVGVGYGFDDGPTDGGYHYGYVVAPSQFPIALQAGLKIGFLFKQRVINPKQHYEF